MRLIDADALITDLNKGLWGKDWDKVLAEAIINEAPSIDIVRCKDCKNTEKRTTKIEGHKYCSVMVGWVDENFYCGYGEVRDE